MTRTARATEPVTNCRFHQTASDQTDRFGKYHHSPRILKIEKKCQLSWEKKEIPLASDVRTQKKIEEINTMTPRGATVVYVKCQITITFTRLPEAHDSIIWAETSYYRPTVMDVVRLFCGQFAELMVFAVQDWRKLNGIMWCLSFLCDSGVQYRLMVQFNQSTVLLECISFSALCSHFQLAVIW